MVTKEQAQEYKHFHEEDCYATEGPKGKVTKHIRYWRANGACKTWKTKPNQFRLPIKRGLREYGYITQDNMQFFHIERHCPLTKNEGF